MQIEQLTQGIEAKFNQSRLVFWYDPEQSFKDEIANLAVDGVTVLDMSGKSIFETKKQIELDEPASRFLLYFPYEQPSAERDWLLDVCLYSEQFFADASSILLNDLGIAHLSLREHLRKRQSFFANKQRFAALKRFITENEDEVSLDRKMIAVLVKAESSSLNDILLRLVADYAECVASDSTTELIGLLDKFKLAESLWNELGRCYGYSSDEPSISDFVLRLFCTELWSQVDAPAKDKDWLLNKVFKSSAAKAVALAFMASWRDSRSYAQSHDVVSRVIAKQLEVNVRCSDLGPSVLLECETFEVVEQIIIRGLVNSLLDTSVVVDRAHFSLILSRRLQGHWCLVNKHYAAAYEALRNAEVLMYLRQQYTDGFYYASASAMYDGYVNELYQFDLAYRLFNEHVHGLFSKGAEMFRQLDENLENLYTNWYLHELGLAWDGHIEKEALLESWRLPKVNNQYQFYESEVKRRLAKQGTKRIFVIISDAMRFEVAHELKGLIGQEKRFETTLGSQLGVLPSYTQLGMASLLPHSGLSYQPDKGAAVYVDGQSSQGLDNRHSILKVVKGMAVSAKTLLSWTNQEGRDAVRDAEVVYIYHDTIDAIGDKLPTEDKTFEACRTAIDELNDMVARVINRLNASRVIVTADHGFLFQQQGLQQPDKTSLKGTPAGAFEPKKRYVLGHDLPAGNDYWKGCIKETSNGTDETEFLIPKGAQRFHFMGGAKFVHGGAMLQEVCVPVISIKVLRGEKAADNQKKMVGVVSSSHAIKIVNNIDKLRFIQTEPVGESFVARKLDFYIVDERNNEVSSRERVNFDSTSSSMEDRLRDVKLKLVGSNFHRNNNYTLILEMVDTKTCYNKYAVTIDLAFHDDFF